MYKVKFVDSFIEWLNEFIIKMKNYYFIFYSNTWIEDEDIIINNYYEIYENFKNEIFTEIHSICENWVLWRKIISTEKDKEICNFSFFKRSYKITFSLIKDNTNKEIIVYNLKIEV